MRRRFAVPLIAAVGLAPWVWFHPDWEKPDAQNAVLVSSVDIPDDEKWAGGFSGVELTADGQQFYMVTDRGHIARGSFSRAADTMTDMSFEEAQPLVDRFGQERDFPHTDAEGIALANDGRIFVSFEHAHRILRYDSWSAPAKWPSYTRAWRALHENRGLEALAIDETGTVFTLPEGIARGASDALVYRRLIGPNWDQPFTIQVDPEFLPVGADFGPDGRLYLLERGIYPFGFFSRVRAVTIGDSGVLSSETVLHTPFGHHGNLEGVAAWRDSTGALRLTMVSDNNFYPFLRSEVVEYRIEVGLALADE